MSTIYQLMIHYVHSELQYRHPFCTEAMTPQELMRHERNEYVISEIVESALNHFGYELSSYQVEGGAALYISSKYFRTNGVPLEE